MDVESAESFERVGGGTRMRWVWEVVRMLGRRLERVMNLGEKRIEMRIPQSAWFPRDFCFLHS